jgi:hypothetical protein
MNWVSLPTYVKMANFRFSFDCELSFESCDVCVAVVMDEVILSSVEGWYLLACRMWHIVLYSWVLCLTIVIFDTIG